MIADFGGRIPRRSKRLLPDNFAQEAYNVKLLSGEVRGIRAPTNVHTFPPGTNPARVWRVRPDNNPNTSYWVYSTVPEAELQRCPLIDDAFERWYLFEPDADPKVMTIDDIANGTGPWQLAFDYPTTRPTLVPTSSVPADERSVVYVYTYVTEWGEETSPSNSRTIKVDDAGSVTVSGFYSPVPVIEGRAYQYVRIYRTVVSGSSGGIFFVAQVDWGVDTYVDSAPDVEVSLNEQLTSLNYNPPPSEIYGVRVHPSGAFVAFKDSTVYFSEPYRPHAWPDIYRTAVADPIVGIEVFEQNVGVFTKGSPVMLYGTSVGQIGILKFSFPEPCVAYGSIVAAPEGAYYASHQGLVLFTAVGPTNITREVISKEEWQNDYLDEDMSAARYGTQYISIEQPGSGFVIDSLEARIALTDFASGTGLQFRSIQEDFYTGDLYLLAGDAVFLWDNPSAEEVDYVWKSKQVVLPRPVNFGAVMVHIEPRENEYIPLGTPPDVYPSEYFDPLPPGVSKTTHVLVEVYTNDVRTFVGWASDREQVRLPSGKKADSWEIRVTGQCRMYSVGLTETGRGQSRVG